MFSIPTIKIRMYTMSIHTNVYGLCRPCLQGRDWVIGFLVPKVFTSPYWVVKMRSLAISVFFIFFTNLLLCKRQEDFEPT
jgi:hypothetical protein